MLKQQSAGTAVTKVITYILVVLLVLGVAGAAVALIMRDRGVTFYVESGDDRYLANDVEGYFTIYFGEMYEFKVSAFDGGAMDYTVKVTANADNNFEFTADGHTYSFYGDDNSLNDYSELFGLTKIAEGFSISVPEGFTLESALESKYGGKIVLTEDLDKSLCYFVLTVTSGDSIVMIKLLNYSDAIVITLSSYSIVF